MIAYYSNDSVERIMTNNLNRDRAIQAYIGLLASQSKDGVTIIKDAPRAEIDRAFVGLGSLSDYGVYLYEDTLENFTVKPVTKRILYLEDFKNAIDAYKKSDLKVVRIFGESSEGIDKFIYENPDLKNLLINAVALVNKAPFEGDKYLHQSHIFLRNENTWDNVVRKKNEILSGSDKLIVEKLECAHKQSVANVGIITTAFIESILKKKPKTIFFESVNDERTFLTEFTNYRMGRHLLFEEKIVSAIKSPDHMLLHAGTRGKYYHVFLSRQEEEAFIIEIQVMGIPYDPNTCLKDYKVVKEQITLTEIIKISERCKFTDGEETDAFEETMAKAISRLEEKLDSKEIIELSEIVLYKKNGVEYIGKVMELSILAPGWLWEGGEPVKTKIDLINEVLIPVEYAIDFSVEGLYDIYDELRKINPSILSNKQNEAITRTFKDTGLVRYLYSTLPFYGPEPYVCKMLSDARRKMSYRRDTYVKEVSRRFKLKFKTLSGMKLKVGEMPIFDIYGNIYVENNTIFLKPPHFGDIQVMASIGLNTFDLGGRDGN